MIPIKDKYKLASVYISEMRNYRDYCPYSKVSAVVCSGLFQVVGISKLTLYFIYRDRLF